MMTEENNDLKETLTREKIKRELLYTHRNEIRSYLLSPIFVFVFEQLICLLLNDINIIDLPVRIIAWILYATQLIFLIANIVCVVKIKKGKFYVVKDILINKKLIESVRVRNLTIRKFHFAPAFYYQFYFSKIKKWAIPDYNYAWSEFYGAVSDVKIYKSAQITDWFYIAYVNKYVALTAFSFVFFCYDHECDEILCGR